MYSKGSPWVSKNTDEFQSKRGGQTNCTRWKLLFATYRLFATSRESPRISSELCRCRFGTARRSWTASQRPAASGLWHLALARGCGRGRDGEAQQRRAVGKTNMNEHSSSRSAPSSPAGRPRPLLPTARPRQDPIPWSPCESARTIATTSMARRLLALKDSASPAAVRTAHPAFARLTVSKLHLIDLAGSERQKATGASFSVSRGSAARLDSSFL